GAAFFPTAAMFLFFALPCFFFVKDPKMISRGRVRVLEAFHALKQTLTHVKQYRLLFKFIIIHFIVLDVVNTIIAFMAIYANKVIGFDNNQITNFLITSTVFAMIGSYFIGILVNRKGSVWSYWLVLGLWIAALTVTVLSVSPLMFWVVGPLAGVGMGGVWVVSRVLLIELSPKDKVGEFFGLYGMAGKLASVLGPLLWGSIVFMLQSTETLKYRAAVFALLIIVLIGSWLFRSLQKEMAAAPAEA
ncbi:MAG: MFS transporter, partial [Nitrospinae bacterium]|nr:MFS transporter [Nitrospinota bacterium]